MPPFQGTVRQFLTDGVIGELANEGPLRAMPWTLNGQGAVLPTVGRVFTYLSDGVAELGAPDDLGVFAGVLMSPKEHALQGTTAGTLQPTLTVPENSSGSLLTMGIIYVDLEVVVAAANFGDQINYRVVDGSFTNAAVASGIVDSGARLITDGIGIAASNLAVIEFTSP